MTKNIQRGGRRLASWAFLIGVVLAVIFGALGTLDSTLLLILVIVGLIVGFLNIADNETTPFLMSGAVLIIASAFGQDALAVLPMVNNVLNALLAIFVPSTVIVAIRNVFSMARN